MDAQTLALAGAVPLVSAGLTWLVHNRSARTDEVKAVWGRLEKVEDRAGELPMLQAQHAVLRAWVRQAAAWQQGIFEWSKRQPEGPFMPPPPAPPLELSDLES